MKPTSARRGIELPGAQLVKAGELAARHLQQVLTRPLAATETAHATALVEGLQARMTPAGGARLDVALLKNARDYQRAIEAEAANPTAAAETEPARRTFKAALGELLSQTAAKVGLTLYEPLRPPPRLTVPVMMLPGLTLDATSLEPMANHFASDPRNGEVAVFSASDGQFHLAKASGRVLSPDEVRQTKIFTMDFKNPKGTATSQAPEVAAMMDKIRSQTGADPFVVSHSASNTTFLNYFRDPSRGKIAGMVLVSPVSHGTVMGDLGAIFGGVLGVKEAAKQLAHGSDVNEKIDAAWPESLARMGAGAVVIAVKSAVSFDLKNGRPVVGIGDTFNNATQVRLEGAGFKVLIGADQGPGSHVTSVKQTGMINAAGDALGQMMQR